MIKETNNFPILILFDGATITVKNNEITNFSFSKSDFPLNNFKTNSSTYIKTQELSSIHLYRCLSSIYFSNKINSDSKIENCTIENIKNIFKEVYKRLIIPFYIPLLSLIVIILILSSKENPDYYKYKIFTFILGLFFIIFSETTIRLISEDLSKNIFIIILPYINFLMLYLFIFKNLKLKYL